MKKLIVSLAFVFPAFAQASECDSTAYDAAEAILKVAATSIGFEDSSVGELQTADENKYVYVGYIYKATYNITVVLDDSCFPKSVKLVEVQN